MDACLWTRVRMRSGDVDLLNTLIIYYQELIVHVHILASTSTLAAVLRQHTPRMASLSPRIPLSVSKKHIICSEILSVTSAMRKNSRWASSAQTPLYARDDALAASLGLRRVAGSSDTLNNGARHEVQLMAGFLELKREVRESNGIITTSSWCQETLTVLINIKISNPCL